MSASQSVLQVLSFSKTYVVEASFRSLHKKSEGQKNCKVVTDMYHCLILQAFILAILCLAFNPRLTLGAKLAWFRIVAV